MVNFDQAEGLRRMLHGAKPRFVTFLSSLGNDEKNAMLVNLSTGLSNLGHDVVLLDARVQGTGVARWLDTSINATGDSQDCPGFSVGQSVALSKYHGNFSAKCFTTD